MLDLIKADCDCLQDYMSQSNHPNAKGHSALIEYGILY
jgi:hypothetical protein